MLKHGGKPILEDVIANEDAEYYHINLIIPFRLRKTIKNQDKIMRAVYEAEVEAKEAEEEKRKEQEEKAKRSRRSSQEEVHDATAKLFQKRDEVISKLEPQYEVINVM